MDIKIMAPQKPFEGAIHIDGDKSITHRAIMISSIANGVTKIDNFLASDDCLSTVNIIKDLGIKIIREDNTLFVHGKGLLGYLEPQKPLYAGNSGTTMRLMTGILSGQRMLAILSGDKSLNSRPMERIISPLNDIGALIFGRNNNTYAPIVIASSKKINSFNYHSKIASAQVKSAILFAALYNDSISTYSEIFQSRDHTERMLKLFNADINQDNNKIIISGKNSLSASNIKVPNDFSTASYFIALAALTEGSRLLLRYINVNETRIGLLKVLEKMGLKYEMLNYKVVSNEPTADLLINSSVLENIVVDKSQIATMIDEIPLLAFIASQSKGDMIINGIEELAYKESNRIKSTKYLFEKFGLDIIVEEDKMIILNTKKNEQNNAKEIYINHFDDHRIAMTSIVMSLVLSKQITMNNSQVINISAPKFLNVINEISKGAIKYV
ncbi:MAG: 3-phosphoshikimate 1-carboxyvinyltransferase [Halanaerobiales bacterium]